MFAKKENYKLTSPVLDCDHPDVVLHLRVRGTDRVALLAAFFLALKKNIVSHIFFRTKKNRKISLQAVAVAAGAAAAREDDEDGGRHRQDEHHQAPEEGRVALAELRLV